MVYPIVSEVVVVTFCSRDPSSNPADVYPNNFCLFKVLKKTRSHYKMLFHLWGWLKGNFSIDTNRWLCTLQKKEMNNILAQQNGKIPCMCCIIINTTTYLLGRCEPSSPSTKELHALGLNPSDRKSVFFSQIFWLERSSVRLKKNGLFDLISIGALQLCLKLIMFIINDVIVGSRQWQQETIDNYAE